jgi:NADP-dependent 3-hydroxy acid dehydrogenase YdfG
MEPEIKGKVIIITGASSGIGAAIAQELARSGAKVVLGARRIERLKSLAEEIRHAGGEVAYSVADVKHREDLERLVALACGQFGRLDVIVNNAGIAQLSRIDALDVEGWEEMIDINFKGVLYGIAAAMPVFKKQGAGHVVNIISTSGLKIVPMQGVYAGTKNAVRTISEALRQESQGDIRVTGISPGFVQTELASGVKNADMRDAIQTTMEKLAITPDAIARAVAFAIGQPANVDVGDIVVRPAAQQ